MRVLVVDDEVRLAETLRRGLGDHIGETGGDLLAQTLKLGYAQASLLFLAIFGSVC